MRAMVEVSDKVKAVVSVLVPVVTGMFTGFLTSADNAWH